MKKLVGILSVGLTAFLGLTATAAARDKACAADLQNFCPSAATWQEKGACLKENESQLSAPCTAARLKRKAKWEARKAAFQKACGADIQTYCSNVPDAKEKPWEIRACLRTNENSVTDACKTELQKKHRHHHES